MSIASTPIFAMEFYVIKFKSYALMSLAILAAQGCDSGSSNDGPGPSPTPVSVKPLGGETVNTDKLAGVVRDRDAANARAKTAEKKAADAEEALKKALADNASPEAIAELTRARDDAQKAASDAKTELEALRKLEAAAMKTFQGSWVSLFDEELGDKCFTIVDVKGYEFKKVITCEKASKDGYLSQVEQGSLENLTVNDESEVVIDFSVKGSSCLRNEGGKVTPVPFASESGSLSQATTLFGLALRYMHPVSGALTLLTNVDACEKPFDATAVACAFLRDAKPIEPENELGCFVKETEPDFVRTKAITAVK